MLFNRNINRGCLVYMLSLCFSGSKCTAAILCTKNFFVYVKFSVHKFLRDLLSFHLVFKIVISKMRNLCSRLLFH